MTKLYVANLPPEATEEALRTHFAVAGGVADVEILVNRKNGNANGRASVTMTSPAFTAAARRLDGVDFGGNLLRVSDTKETAESLGTPRSTVKIVQQFRERSNMTYDLDCNGAPLTLRIWPVEDGTWRIEARATDRADANVIAASGTKRMEILRDVLREWNETASSSVPRVDAEAVMKAMHDVRAV